MNKITDRFFSLLLLISVVFYGCATAPQTSKREKPEEGKPPEKSKAAVVHTEQEVQSLNVFGQILDLIQSTDERQSVLPQVETLYEKIIRDYPDAPLAQESYWKLITIYINDYSPPAYERAEARYEEFMDKYPQSALKSLVQDTIGKSYHKNAEWDRLLRLSAPEFRDYTEKGKQPRASLFYLYSEAQYNLGNLEEAERGYRVVAESFPNLIVGKKSKSMLDKMKKNSE